MNTHFHTNLHEGKQKTFSERRTYADVVRNKLSLYKENFNFYRLSLSKTS